MKKLLFLLSISFLLLSCGEGKTPEEMRQDHIKAEQIRADRQKGKVAAENRRQLNKLKKELDK